MGIYTRDNINYGGMLANALQSKSNYLKNRYDRVAQMGQNWGNAVANSGKVAQDAMFKIAGNYYDQDKIAQQQAFQASEAEKRALEALERQKQQEEFQKAENALNRQNTMDIAKLNKDIAADEKKDEYQLHYQKAKANLDLIGEQYNKDPNNIQLKKAYEDAKFDVDYWAKKAGANVAATQPTAATPEFSDEFLKEVRQSTEPKYTNEEILNQYKKSIEGKWDNARRATALELAQQLPEGLRATAMIEIQNKGMTSEERQAAANKELNDANAEWLRTGEYDSKKFKIVYEGPGNAHLVRK